jgi:hypothetical protein
MLAAAQTSLALGVWTLAKCLAVFHARLRRPIYYPRERLRRQRLAKERRRVRDRFTLNPCPEPARLREAYAEAASGIREAVRFGSLLCDLEAYCDNSLVRNVDGEIVGRNPGVKGWLRSHCPEVAAHYANAMRYKGIAEKFRQGVGACDPVPAEALAAADGAQAKGLFREGKTRRITVQTRKVNGDRQEEVASETYTLERDAVEAAWRRAQELIALCEGAATAEDATSGKPETKTVSGKTGKTRLRCGIAEGKGEKGRGRGKGKGKENGKGRKRGWGSVAKLVAELDERLAPEFAPTGWMLASVSPPKLKAPVARTLA